MSWNRECKNWSKHSWRTWWLTLALLLIISEHIALNIQPWSLQCVYVCVCCFVVTWWCHQLLFFSLLKFYNTALLHVSKPKGEKFKIHQRWVIFSATLQYKPEFTLPSAKSNSVHTQSQPFKSKAYEFHKVHSWQTMELFSLHPTVLLNSVFWWVRRCW